MEEEKRRLQDLALLVFVLEHTLCLRFSLLALVLTCASRISAQVEQNSASSRQSQEERAFHWDHLPPWLTLQMEWRERIEDQTAIALAPGKERLYNLTRVRGSLDLRPTRWFETYAQFHDLHAPGLPLRDVSSNMRDNFDLRQGYINFHHDTKIQTFIGRQLLIFGDERVIGISDWSNTSRSWDGFDLRIDYPHAKVDLFSTSVVQIHPTSLDTHGAGLTFHGAWGNLMNLLPHTSFMPFVLFRTYPRVKSRQGIFGRETEATFGMEWSVKLPKGFESTGLGDLQRGSYSNQSIHAGAAIVRGGWSSTTLPLHPHIVAGYKFSSGDPGRNPFRISTYDQQYPGNHNAFGLVDLFGFQNMKQRRLSITLTPHPGWTMTFQGESMHAASRFDHAYSGSATVVAKAPAGGFARDGIGTGFDASMKHLLRTGLELQIGVGHFFPGYVMTHGGAASPLTLSYLQFTYRFKATH